MKEIIREDDETLRRWLNLAAMAPSAANLQPWSYVGKKVGPDFELSLKVSPEFLRSPSPLDPYCVTAFLALGCFAKNFEIAAALDGFSCELLHLNGTNLRDWEWKIICRPNVQLSLEPHASQETILKRVSNRTNYSRTPIDPSLCKGAQSVIQKYKNLELNQISAQQNLWADLLTDLESIRLSEDHLRQELFSEFRTAAEIKNDPVGIPINTISNSSLIQLLIYTLKKLPLLQNIFKFGFKNLFSWLSLHRPLFYSEGLFALRSLAPESEKAFQLGQALEESWLYWTEKGYSMQVIALPILIYGNREGILGQSVSASSRAILEESFSFAKEKLNIDLNHLTLLLRVGRTTSSTPLSPRRKILQ